MHILYPLKIHALRRIILLKKAIEVYEAYIEGVADELGDFSPFDTPADDPRWDIVNTLPPADLSYLNAKKRDAQERAIKNSEVRDLQLVPKAERGGVWDFVSTDLMNMNGDPLELTNPVLARQLRMDKIQKDIEASIEAEKPIVRKIGAKVISRFKRN